MVLCSIGSTGRPPARDQECSAAPRSPAAHEASLPSLIVTACQLPLRGSGMVRSSGVADSTVQACDESSFPPKGARSQRVDGSGALSGTAKKPPLRSFGIVSSTEPVGVPTYLAKPPLACVRRSCVR